MRRIRVVIAHEHPVILRGLSSVLEAEREFEVVARCADLAGCSEALVVFRPDIAIVGVSRRGVGGLESLLSNSEDASTRVVVFATVVEEGELQVLAAAGVRAVVPQDVDIETLVQMLREVADGRRLRSSDRIEHQQESVTAEKSATALTERERQIMRLVSEGLPNKEIGRRLNLTDGTIKVHLHHIFQKLELSNRTALAAFAISQVDHSDSSVED